MSITLVILFLAVIALFVGAEFSLNAAEKVGKLFGIPPLVIGLLIIGLGTSLPEFFVSHLAAMSERGQMAIGNIVGSNISNILLVLGISIIIQKIVVNEKSTLYQLAIHLLLSVVLSGVLFFDELSLVSCLILIAFFIGHLCFTSRSMKRQRKSDPGRFVPEQVGIKEKFSLSLKLLMGFTLLYFGGEGLVTSGGELCRLFGVSEYVISVIVIALGTSLPELVTSLLAAAKKKDFDLILGNIIGSNIFNVAFVMGSLIFYRIDLSRSFKAEISILLASSLCLLIFAYKRWPLGRSLGVAFVLSYMAMVYYWI